VFVCVTSFLFDNYNRSAFERGESNAFGIPQSQPGSKKSFREFIHPALPIDYRTDPSSDFSVNIITKENSS